MTPETLLICPVIGLVVLLTALRGPFTARERSIIVYAFLAHVVGAFAIVVYHQYIFEGGDMYVYALYGREIGALLRRDFGWAPDVLRLLFHQENRLPLRILLEGSTTGTMEAMTGCLMFIVGDSSYGVSLLLSFFSFSGALSLFRSIEWKLLPAERVPTLVGFMLVPSAVFWSSGIVKETLVVGFLGVLCLGLTNVVVGLKPTGVLRVVVGIAGVAMVKPYVLLPLVLAIGAWFFAARQAKLGIVYKVLGVVIAVGGLVLLMRFFPEYGVDKLGESVARQQKSYTIAGAGAGSNLDIGDFEDEIQGQSVGGQMKYVPLALINSLMRPLPFDVSNLATLLAAVEMTALLLLILQLVYRHGPRQVVDAVVRRPLFVAAFVFVVVFGAAVGLVTRNLGTLSRYRVPMMPVYVGLVLGLRAALGAGARDGPSRTAPREPGRRSISNAQRVLAAARARRRDRG